MFFLPEEDKTEEVSPNSCPPAQQDDPSTQPQSGHEEEIITTSSVTPILPHSFSFSFFTQFQRTHWSDESGSESERSEDVNNNNNNNSNNINNNIEQNKQKSSAMHCAGKVRITIPDLALLDPATMQPLDKEKVEDASLTQGYFEVQPDNTVKYIFMNILVRHVEDYRKLYGGFMKSHKVPVILQTNSCRVPRKLTVCSRYYDEYLQFSKTIQYFYWRKRLSFPSLGVLPMIFHNYVQQRLLVKKFVEEVLQLPHIFSCALFHAFFYTDVDSREFVSSMKIFPENLTISEKRNTEEIRLYPTQLTDAEILLLHEKMTGGNILVGYDALDENTPNELWEDDPGEVQQQQQQQGQNASSEGGGRISPDHVVNFDFRNKVMSVCTGDAPKTESGLTDRNVFKLNHEEWNYRSWLDLGHEEKVRERMDGTIEAYPVQLQQRGHCPDHMFCYVAQAREERKRARKWGKAGMFGSERVSMARRASTSAQLDELASGRKSSANVEVHDNAKDTLKRSHTIAAHSLPTRPVFPKRRARENKKKRNNNNNNNRNRSSIFTVGSLESDSPTSREHHPDEVDGIQLDEEEIRVVSEEVGENSQQHQLFGTSFKLDTIPEEFDKDWDKESEK